VNRRLVLVIGFPRSGTTALFDGLSTSPGVVAHHEPDDSPERRAVDDPFYFDERLRPEPEVAERIRSASGPVLLRPMEDLATRSLDAVFAEYAGYDLRVVWLYRDAAKVLGSAVARGWWEPTRANIDRAILEWNRRNRLVLGCSEPDLIIVRYEDLTADPALVARLGDRLGLVASPVFGADLGRGLDRLAPPDIDRIRSETAAVRLELDGRRSLLPSATTGSGRRNDTTPIPARGTSSVADRLERAARNGPARRPPDDLPGLRLWLEPAGLEAAPSGDLHSWRPARPGLPGGRVRSGRPVRRPLLPPAADRLGALWCPGGGADAADLVDVGDADDWGFTTAADFTAILVLSLPREPSGVWSPVVATGAPFSGDRGWAVVWIGPSAGQRPTRPADATARRSAPAAGLLAAGITQPRDRPPQSLLQAHLAAAVEVDATPDPWTVLVCRHRVLVGSSRLTLATPGSGVLVTGGPADPDPTVGQRDGLTIGGAASGPAPGYPGAVAEVQLFDRALDDDEIGSLLLDLTARHPQLDLDRPANRAAPGPFGRR
jgi:hypothetical protein